MVGLMFLKVCELCGKPTQLGHLHADAVVVHLECLKKQMKEVREFVQSVNSEKKEKNGKSN
jgi:hypothetical protein